MPFFLIIFILCGWGLPAWGETSWDVRVLSGYNSAALNTLNSKKLTETSIIPPAIGGSPEIHGGALIGAEVEWKIRPRFSLVALTTFWEGESTAVESGEVFFQDFGIVPFQDRRITRLSFNEYALRGRYYLLEQPKRYRFYLETGLFDQVIVTFREDYRYSIQAGNQEYLRNILSQAVSKGGYLLVGGMGGDIYLTRWLAFNLSGEYRVGKAIPLYYTSYRHTFLEREAISGGNSPFPKEGDPVTYLDGNTRLPLVIELKGWQVTAGFRIFF